MAADGNNKRPAPISWRPPANRREEFERRVAESGLSPNAFITEAVFGTSRHRPAELRYLARILGQCASIRDQLREVEMTSRHLLILEAIHKQLIEIRSALFRLMVRNP